MIDLEEKIDGIMVWFLGFSLVFGMLFLIVLVGVAIYVTFFPGSTIVLQASEWHCATTIVIDHVKYSSDECVQYIRADP